MNQMNDPSIVANRQRIAQLMMENGHPSLVLNNPELMSLPANAASNDMLQMMQLQQMQHPPQPQPPAAPQSAPSNSQINRGTDPRTPYGKLGTGGGQGIINAVTQAAPKLPINTPGFLAKPTAALGGVQQGISQGLMKFLSF